MKLFKLFAALFLLAAPGGASAGNGVGSLRCEYMATPLGLDTPQPRLMWKIEGKTPCRQTACRIRVATSPGTEANVWDSGVLKTDAQTVRYDGPALEPHTRYWWTVETWLDGKPVRSRPTWFETAKMDPADWSASWITDHHDREYEPAPLFRRDFSVGKRVASARCYVSGLGYYELYLNGEKVGDNRLDPGFTDYSKRALYTTYDVTPYLARGVNTVGLRLGNGWYNEQTPTVWYFHESPWRNRPRAVCELLVTYTDGSHEVIGSDPSWKTATGGLLFDNIHVGATYDARLEPAGWNAPGFDDARWTEALPAECPVPVLEAMKMPPIRVSQQIAPVSVTQKNDTTWVFDMGVNFAGLCRLNVRGPRGTRITLTHAEMLDADGMPDQQNINMHLRPRNEREKIQTDVFILAGTGAEEFTPPFTYHGFRYVQLTADRPVEIDRRSLTGLVMHSDVERTGSFACSDEMLNRIYEIANRSYLSNLYGLPTDCPTREKNGWLADGFMVQQAGMLTYDSRNVYAKWLQDIIDSQQPDGNVAGIAPTSWRWDSNWAGPIWDAALFIVPYRLYRLTGDTEAMLRAYPAAQRYLRYIEASEDKRGLIAFGLGDWLTYKAVTDVGLMASGYVVQDFRIAAEMAELAGQTDQAKRYREKAAEMTRRINDTFFDPATVSYANKTQLSYALPLYLDLVPAEYRAALAENLRKSVADNAYNLDFGFIGSVMVPDALAASGNAEAAYRMATRTTLPSWGYWIEQTGATSLYETWDVTRHIGDASMNHPSMGAINAWMYTCLAGIDCDPATPGFRKIVIKPAFVEGLDWVKASVESPYGPIESQWERRDGSVQLRIRIPATSTATVSLPGQATQEVRGGEHRFTVRL